MVSVSTILLIICSIATKTRVTILLRGFFSQINDHLQKFGDYFFLVGDSGTTFGAVSDISRSSCGSSVYNISSVSIMSLFQALKSSEKSKNPIYVSIGHNVSLETSLKICELCCRYRVPEPIRQVANGVLCVW